jgi:integrase
LARTVRNARLENRTQRLKLPPGKRHWSSVAPGIALGYRRTRAGFGTWSVRVLEDNASGRYSLTVIGVADDLENANGREVLTYFQAVDKARAVIGQARDKAKGERSGPFTVADAVDEYLTWFRLHRKSAKATETTLKAHVVPEFGRTLVADLTTREIARWHERLATAAPRRRKLTPGSKRAKAAARKLAREPSPAPATPPPAPAAPPTPDELRARKASANRVLSVLRAVLNHAWRAGHVPSDAAWRRVKPFHNAGEPRVRYLTAAEATRLANASPADFRALVTAALLTGCRYGELVNLYVEDYHRDARAIHVRDSKSGRPRHVPLTEDGEAFFAALTTGRAAAETMLLRADGRPWGVNHQVKPMASACAAASIDPPVSFHILRHTYGSWLAMAGVPLQVIAEALGHADTRITQRHYGHLAPSYVAQVIRESLPSIPVTSTNVVALDPSPPGRARAATRKAKRP